MSFSFMTELIIPITCKIWLWLCMEREKLLHKGQEDSLLHRKIVPCHAITLV